MGGIMIKDVAVIGGGIGGYTAAIRASQLGKTVVLINDGNLGGTCLNVGCIPTKSFLHSARLYEDVRYAEKHGIKISGEVGVDWSKILLNKQETVHSLVSGVKKLISSNDIEYLEAKASFIDQKTLRAGDIDIVAENIIIATGSEPFVPPISGVDLEGVINSTQALSLENLPEDIIIIGGGVIGMEFAQIFSSFGVKTTIIEMLEKMGGVMDSDISALVQDAFENRGIDVNLNCSVEKIERSGSKLKLTYTENGKNVEIEAGKVLLATGRKSYTEGLGLENIGIELNKGKIPVDEYLRTKCPNIYAIGDVSSHIMLAHLAEEEGILVAEKIGGLNPEGFDYSKTPSCVYTSPEIAFVGMTEDEAKKKNIKYRTGLFYLSANAKSVIEGMIYNTVVKLLFDDEYDNLIGAHIYGKSATELIGEMTLAIDLEATAEEIIQSIHPHPTVSEALKEASLDSYNRAIHSMKKS